MPFNRTNNGKVRLFPKAVGKSTKTSCLANSGKIICFCSELNSSDIPMWDGLIEHSGAGMKLHADLSAVDCQVSINMWPTAPIRAPVHPVYGFCKQTRSVGRRIFPSSPLPPPSFLTQSSSPLGSLLTFSGPLALPRPRWQQWKIIQRSRTKTTPALQARLTVKQLWIWLIRVIRVKLN